MPKNNLHEKQVYIAVQTLKLAEKGDQRPTHPKKNTVLVCTEPK
jgi:hypothetical protein